MRKSLKRNLLLCLGALTFVGGITGCHPSSTSANPDDQQEENAVVIEPEKVDEIVDIEPQHIVEVDSSKWAMSTNDTRGFCVLTDSVPSAILDIRYYGSHNFVGCPVDGYEQPIALITQRAAHALKEVADELAPQRYVLKIYDAYRPQMAVDHFVRWAKVMEDTLTKAEFYPMIEKNRIIPDGFVASHSGHTRGSTVDLTLVYSSTGEDVDMGSSFDFFGDISFVFNGKISSEQQANRVLLREAMMRHGFKPYKKEWWHFTLKDEPYKKTYFTFPNHERVIREREASVVTEY